jgi:hypothetical protein
MPSASTSWPSTLAASMSCGRRALQLTDQHLPDPFRPGVVFDPEAARQRKSGHDRYSFFARKRRNHLQGGISSLTS